MFLKKVAGCYPGESSGKIVKSLNARTYDYFELIKYIKKANNNKYLYGVYIFQLIRKLKRTSL